MHRHFPAPRFSDRGLAWLLAMVFVITFITGGGSQDRGPGDALAQLAALPLLVWAALALSTRPLTGLRRMAIGVCLLVVSVPLLQLLPLPAAIWQANPARAALAQDLSVAGAVPLHRWTLTPAATMRAVLALLPALSVFVGVLALHRHDRLRMLWLFLALALASLLLGLVQLGLPRDSLLNPFPQWPVAFRGVFANPNHQAISLACAATVALSLLLTRRHGEPAHGRQLAIKWALGLCCVLCVAAIPLTGSRGGALIAALAMVSVPMALGVFRRSRLRDDRRARWGLVVVLGGAILGVWISLQWLQVDAVSGMRWSLTKATVVLGNSYAPLGSGVGSFVPLFEQEGPAGMLGWEYINHAHNEYAQWWLEGGVLAMLALAAVFTVLAVALLRVLQSPARSTERAIAAGAWLGSAALLVHSTVDYPMRTASLMATAALLAGIAVAQAGDAKPGRPTGG